MNQTNCGRAEPISNGGHSHDVTMIHYQYVPNPKTGKFDGKDHGMTELLWCRKCGAYRWASFGPGGGTELPPILPNRNEWVSPAGRAS